ncbi:hypothetical protein D0Z08_31120 [Nocardioides immobilis]|uniref:Uncharacterized protein n=1 Tax=Nocardioides immobilis TaxID=2049295 RepID=A0A417XRS7_9ACTN|nr:hypothetical protein D0Z08_31120 [Nocardioides immobilis]
MASPTSDQYLVRASERPSPIDLSVDRFALRRDPDDLCVCGHPRKAHEHLRRGTDCSLCRAGECPRFRRARRVRLSAQASLRPRRPAGTAVRRRGRHPGRPRAAAA